LGLILDWLETDRYFPAKVGLVAPGIAAPGVVGLKFLGSSRQVNHDRHRFPVVYG
jgi:hypothetical protein